MGSIPWAKLMEQLAEVLKNEKVSSTLIGVLAIFVYYAHAWASAEHAQLDDASAQRHLENQQVFATKEEFEELQNAVENVSHTLDTVGEDANINNAKELVRDKKLELRIIRVTGGTEREIHDIQEEIKLAIEYRDCLVNRQPNCHHKVPPE